MSKFDNLYAATGKSQATKVLHAVRNAIQQTSREGLKSATALAFSRESLSTSGADTMRTTMEGLQGALARSLAEANVADLVHGTQMTAAVESAVLAGDAGQHLRRTVSVESDKPNFAGLAGLNGAFAQRMKVAREAYNEQDNASVLENTLTYNLLAGRQNKAGELFFPSSTVPSDNTGVAVTIRLYQTHEDIEHAITGTVTDFKRRNLIDGLIDSSILRNDGTLAIPVHRAENASMFAAGVTAVDKTFEGRTIKTAPMAFGKEMNLISLSADDAMLAAGVMDRTDSLDTDVKLSRVYLKVGADIIAIRADVIAGNNFIYVGQDNYRVQKLSLRTKTLYIDKNTKTFANAALAEAGLTGIATGNLVVRLSGSFTGEVNIETGALVVDPSTTVKVESVYDADTKTDVTATTGAAFKTALEAGKWIGYDVQTRRANANRRERGQLVDTQYYTQIWAVPLRSPVTALRPVNTDGAQDGDDLEKLAATTFIRTSGAAVQTVLETIDQLRSIQGMNMEPGVQPESLGVGRHLVNSMLIEESVDAAANVGSLNSSDLEDDISAMLVNRIRDVVYRLYRDSKFQAVVESGAAGTTEQPTVLVMTDPMTARYLMVKGEIRLAGPDFKMVVESSPNKDVEGKIIVAFGYPGKTEGGLNALHFGAMLWSPELALVLPISRRGQTSKELTVQPRFRHIVNVPVLGVVSVKNLSQVVAARVPVNFKTIP